MSNNLKQYDLADMLCNGMVKLGLDPVDYPMNGFTEYIRLLTIWNDAYNLTAIRKPVDIVTHHLLDSLSIIPYVNGNQCLDAGTGAGLPGIILAMSKPEQEWLLVDSTRKKIRFLQQVIIELKISNVTLIHSRVEKLTKSVGYSTVTARALGNLKRSYHLCRHLINGSGKLLLMKGANIRAELAEMSSESINLNIIDLEVPGLEGKRKLVEISSLPPAL